MDIKLWYGTDRNAHRLIQQQEHTSAPVRCHQSEDLIEIRFYRFFSRYQAVEEHHHRDVWSKGGDEKA